MSTYAEILTPPDGFKPSLWWDGAGAHVLQGDGTYKVIPYQEGDECLCHMRGLMESSE